MKTIKQVKEKMEAEGKKFSEQWLQLGIKQEKGGVKSTGFHAIKVVEEKGVVMGSDHITGKEKQELLFIVEEAGQLKRWSVDLYDKQGNPHYLLPRLENIELGQEFGLEMKRRGMKNYIEVTYPLKKEEVINYEDGQTSVGENPSEDIPPPEDY